ncbi:aprataxin and PNK-like factor isoform X2 [Uranotaenia lowii]|uniref:aprataxin and PNK-like factor isoform X2 n=1 Tax=Uranotaenia lowii TaxID=190385 RepID=UPI00247A82B6|nr:aprataxin and PNK-like factor isoform X2 [Uranotaenia lowii]
MNTNLLFLHDCDKNIDIPLPATETIIGRDSFLQCNDKRISRQHGILRPGSDPAGSDPTVQITATHSNPIFIRTGDQVLNILTKDLTATLRPGEKFALLPDQYWFEVRSVGTGAEPSVAADSSEVPQSAAAAEEHQQQDPAPQDEASERVPPQDSSTETGSENMAATNQVVTDTASTRRVLPDWMNSGGETKGTKRKTESKIPADNSKKLKTPQNIQTPGVTEDTEPGAGTSTSQVETNINDATTGENSSPKQTTDTQEAADTASTRPLRTSCRFGINCYQENPHHLARYAHPNDQDYRRPKFPPARSDAPVCPFGAKCYRRNSQHFDDYRHPDADDYEVPSATVSPANSQQQPPSPLPTKRRRRQTKKTGATSYTGDASDDDEYGEELFGDGSDSDDYHPDRDDGTEDDDDYEEDLVASDQEDDN